MAIRPAAALASIALCSIQAAAADLAASPPQALAVTIYRAPDRRTGSIDLDDLGGFALVTETRTIHLPAGESRLRFEGVADGIEPASAIVAGLPSGVIEKNRDAHLLSPSALVAAAVGKRVGLVRREGKAGRTKIVPGTILTDADGGVVFRSADGIEALRCSGLPETFEFEPVTTGLSARPTLSVRTRADRPVDATVTLSYLARGFDWAADYVATLSTDGRTLDLGAWVTLANSNGGGFPDASTQVVAGRLNRTTGDIEPIDDGHAILAQCWPRGSTSEVGMPEWLVAGLDEIVVTGSRMEARFAVPMPPPPPPPAMAPKVSEEQLGDLKLYRVPTRTTVAARQSKQVRLLDRRAIPVERAYEADLPANAELADRAAALLFRTRNDAAHHLGLPLPSGRAAVFQLGGARPLLIGEAEIGDTALDEEVEFRLGSSPDVRVRQTVERPTPARVISHVEISNARAVPIAFELRLRASPGAKVVAANHALAVKNGRPIFRLAVPANGRVTVTYAIAS